MHKSIPWWSQPLCVGSVVSGSSFTMHVYPCLYSWLIILPLHREQPIPGTIYQYICIRSPSPYRGGTVDPIWPFHANAAQYLPYIRGQQITTSKITDEQGWIYILLSLPLHIIFPSTSPISSKINPGREELRFFIINKPINNHPFLPYLFLQIPNLTIPILYECISYHHPILPYIGNN